MIFLNKIHKLLQNRWLRILLIATLYFIAAHIGLLLAYKNTNASPVWPPSGLALALLILFEYSVWPGILIGAFVVNYVSFVAHQVAPIPTIIGNSFAISVGNTLEALIAYYLYHQWVGNKQLLAQNKNVFMLAAVAAISAIVSSVIGVGILYISGVVPLAAVPLVWRTWYLGDVSGMLIFTPLILVWSQPIDKSPLSKKSFIELIVCITLLLCASEFVFTNFIFGELLNVRPYIFIPLVLWTAFRQNNRVIISVLVGISILAIIATTNMRGPFSGGTLNQSLIELELFVSVIMISFMALAALLTEQKKIAQILKDNQDDLERRVAERTHELQRVNQKLVQEIKKHENTERELKHTEIDFMEACRIVSLGHWQWDIVNNKITWSNELVTMFGIDPDTFNATYEGYLQYIHPEDRELVNKTIMESFQTGFPFELDHRLVRFNNEVRWVHSHGQVISDEKGNRLKMTGTAQDITSVKEREVLSSYIAAIVENSADGILSVSHENIITSWNKGAEQILGYSENDVLGTNMFANVPADGLAESLERVELVKKGKTIALDTTARRKDGSFVDISVTYSPIKDAQDIVNGIAIIMRDVTKRKKEEDARFKLIVESAPNAMVLVNAEGKIEITNSQTEKLFGYNRNELLGNTIEILLPERFRGGHPGHRFHFFAKPEARSMGVGRELFGMHKNGTEIPVEIGLNPIETPEGMLVLAAIIDITERKKMEEISRAKQVAEASILMKDHFMANMSHEIRTPMNAIIGFVDLLDKTALSVEQKQFMNAVKSSGQNLLTIINDILDFSKIEAGKLALEQMPMNISDLLASLNEMIKLKMREKGLELVFDYDRAHNYLVLGDPTRLTQILINLLSNAIKFTEKGNVILQARVLAQNEHDYTFEFKVKDTGVGIPQDKLDVIFERFTQASSDTTRKYGGTGLGLSIVKSLVELHGGTVNMESVVGQGSTFTVNITYPRLKNAHEYVPHSEYILPEVPSIGNIQVLVVEDNIMNQQLALTLLRNFGFTAEVADNGQLAVEKIAAKVYDVILMDIQMPVKDGYDATVYIRKQLQSDVPIIAMTAHAMAGEREKCIRLGMNDYLSKPYKAADLLSKITEVVKPRQKKAQSIPIADKSNKERATNMDYLMEMSGGSKEFIIEMIEIFLRQVPLEIQRLETAVNTGDYLSVKNIAHKLKSSAAMVGIIQISTTLATLQELGAKEGNMDEIKAHFADVKRYTTQAFEELKAYMENNA